MSDHHDKHHHKEDKHHHQEEKHHHGEEYSQGPYGSQPPSSAYGGGYSQSGAPAGYPPQTGGGYSQSGAPAGYPPQTGGGHSQYGAPAGYPPQSAASHESKEEAEKRAAAEKSHKRNEHLAEFGALASGAFALYEQHKVKVDPENGQRHRIEESIAGVTALGSGGLALYEKHKVTIEHKADAASNPDPQKHHSFFK